MRRGLAALASAVLLAALIPGSVAADEPTRFEDHHVGFFCEIEIDGGIAVAHIDVSAEFGDFGGAEVWFDPAVPFDEPPSLSGSTEDIQIIEGPAQIDLSAAFTVFDDEGVELGAGSIAATLTPAGPPEPFEEPSLGNRHSKTEGTFQPMAGTGTLILPGLEVELSGCSGDVTDIRVFETNPHAFVLSNQGVFVSCFWETPDATAFLFAVQDGFGTFADAFLVTAEEDLFATGESSVALSVESLNATIGLTDPAGNTFSATAVATLTPAGDPVTSTILSSSFKDKVTEQPLAADGELAFSTGDTFVMDQSSCFSVAFDSHQVDSAPGGPKPGGRTPVNDTPDGAIELAPGARLDAQTRGASLEPEEPITTCPEGEFDKMGRTLWYSFAGTGGSITIDTGGSNFDTVVAVYQPEGDGFTEVACVDDVFGDPVGISFQAVVTLDTVEGATYYVQVGGFDDRTFGGDVEFGRLRLRID